MNVINIKNVEKLFSLMKEYRIDELEIESIKIKKSNHDPRIQPAPPKEESDDELLYYSSDT